VTPARALAAGAALLLGAACRDAAPPRESSAPALPRAAVVLEPNRIGVGQTATLEIALATPPGHVPQAPALPDAVPGLWILGVESLPVEREAGRWLHRTRVRVRAREVGKLSWPGSVVEIATPEGGLQLLAVEPLPIEVVSILTEYPDRGLPFGAREPAEPAPGGLLAGAAAGAGAALAAVAAARVLRRRRARSLAAAAARAAPPRAEAEPAWERTRAALAEAQRLAVGDPFAASDLAARELRRYASRRFLVAAQAATSEELAARPAPFAAATRWPLLVAALQTLDAHRFRPRDDPEARAGAARAVEAGLDLGLRFVVETLPPGTVR
jgi:hypothetical protein